ncbi:G2/mitotic-specific cyclin-B3-like [Gigantopelta aegis]|uniref:G2/mitotic-specific cyclin-B3-like n=1 Tax=Gigantopelta aegis TaxID=1735272 RepID=UPI001B88C8B9|nr:G2/mitotic-specific cyclin-B3-like [Gigantopelta aegis]
MLMNFTRTSKMNRKPSTKTKSDGGKKSKTGGKINSDVSEVMSLGGKRQGDLLLEQLQKRAAFGDITNALKDNVNNIGVKKSQLSKNAKPLHQKTKAKENVKETKYIAVDDEDDDDDDDDDEFKLSQEVLSSQELETHQDLGLSLEFEPISNVQDSDLSSDSIKQDQTVSEEEDLLCREDEIDDIDVENLGDPVQVSFYAKDIFNYYKEREVKFRIKKYMSQQPHLTSNMRSILVDWLVEVQENFELNHETLYLAVKLVDTFLSIQQVPKENLQLIGAVSLFISCKFDERCPPLIEDFLYICDDAYNRRAFIRMEINILKTVGFDLGMPLSYRFLRRYAKCGRASMETLTLARFLLEMSLMDMKFIEIPESKMAAAALHLALRMKKEKQWSRTLEYFTGYKEADLKDVTKLLNQMNTAPQSKPLTTIRSKYSHKVFYEVTKIPALSEKDL